MLNLIYGGLNRMALINKLDNIASISYNGDTVNSNTAETLLLLAPTITKSVDNATASVGDTLTYTVVITSVSLALITNLPFTDVIPEGATYIADSFTVNTVAATPTLTGNTLTYTLPSLLGLAIATIQFQVEVVGGEI